MKTPEAIRWHELSELSKKDLGKVPRSFVNSALTVDGELCIGMTLNKSFGYYGCTYTQLNGARDFGGARRWNLHGEATDGGSDLDISTVQLGLHTT